MKQLQNNFTTPEQSKRLLEIGIPADSADCFYDKNFFGGTIVQTRMGSDWRKSHKLFSGVFKDVISPCWSVGRLIEILSHCYNWNESIDIKFTGGCLGIPRYTHKDNYLGGAVGFIVREIENAIATKSIDFSKLEE